MASAASQGEGWDVGIVVLAVGISHCWLRASCPHLNMCKKWDAGIVSVACGHLSLLAAGIMPAPGHVQKNGTLASLALAAGISHCWLRASCPHLNMCK